MPALSDTQAVILSAAAQRAERIALPLPESLRGGAAAKVVSAMIAKGLLQGVDANLRRGEPVWRKTGDGHGTTLVATDDGLAAIGIDPDDTHTDPAEAAPMKSRGKAALDLLEAEATAPETVKPTRAKKAREPKEGGHTPRTGSKQAAMIEMLRKPEGTTIPEIMAATGWQAHTVRGAFAGALKKKLGLEVTSEKIEGRGRVYRIA